MVRPNVNVSVGGPINNPPRQYKSVILKANIPFALQIGDPYTKYIIKYDFDLNGGTVEMPSNCILEFDGGSLKNGTIIGQDTLVINVGDVDIWGDNLIIEGTWREKQDGGGIPDKEYDPEHNSGLGRKTLQLKDGSNILTQDDFDQENTIYVITYDFDLNGESIEVPEGCVLDFEGGSLDNGKLIGNNTRLLNYDGKSNALYGLYYSIDNELLNSSYTKPNDFHITECHRFVDDIVNYEGLTEYQNIVRYGDYLFLLGYPWVKAGATDPTHYPLFIRVFTLDKYRFVGTVYTNVQSHANGATIANDTLYVCVSDGHKDSNGQYINPDRKCLHTFDCNAIISAAQNASQTPIANGRIDLSYLETELGGDITYVEGIDYDRVNEEFAILFGGFCVAVVLDKNLNFLRKTENYKTAALQKYNYQIGNQDISFKNGIIYGLFCRYDNGEASQHNAAHTTVITIDTVSGHVIDVKELLNNHSWWESQGAFKDPDNEEQIWTLMNERRYDVAVNAVTVFTICKIAPTELTLKDTGNSIPTDSYVKPLINNGKYLNIYVDSTVDNTIQDGSITYPYKSLHQAIHTVMTLSENITFKCKKGGTYEAQFTYVLNRAIRIQSYGTGNNPIVKVNGSFINCHVSISNVVLMPVVGMSSHQGATFFLTNCVFLLSDSTVKPLNYDESIADPTDPNYHNKNNWRIATGFVSAQCSYVDINNCKFIGLTYILYAYRVLNGSITSVSFEGVTNLLQLPGKGVADISVKEYGASWYSNIVKLIQTTGGAVTTRPFVKFCGYTINNALTSIIVAKKNGVNDLVSYKQLGTRTVSTNDDGLSIVTLKCVITEFADSIGISSEQLETLLLIDDKADLIAALEDYPKFSLNGVLEQGEYLYNDGRFEDAFYHILGCATRGTTGQRPTPKYPFLAKTGMRYWDFTTVEDLVWNGMQWVSGNGGATDNYVTLEANSDLNDIYDLGTYLCQDMATAQTITGNPFKDTYPSGFSMMVVPIGSTSELGRRMQIIFNFSDYRVAMRYSKDLNNSQRDGYYFWKFVETEKYDVGNGTLKVLGVGDSILRGFRNGERAFFPYVTSYHKKDAISGARLSSKNESYDSKCKPIWKQLVDETSYAPDVIIAGTGINDWNQDASLGTPPTTIVTNDEDAEHLDKGTVYGAVQYLFYQMIKKYPHAQRFFIPTIKFDMLTTDAIRDDYTDLTRKNYTETNAEGYSYVDMLEGIKKICARYGVVYIDILNMSFVNAEFAVYRANTRYSQVSSEELDEWNSTYYVDVDGIHPTDRCYREVFAPIIRRELELGTIRY